MSGGGRACHGWGSVGWVGVVLAVVVVVVGVLFSGIRGTAEVVDEKTALCSDATSFSAACNGSADPVTLDLHTEEVLPVLRWASENGAEGIDNLDVRYFNKSGHQVRGLAAVSKLKRGKVALHIPEKLILKRDHPHVVASPFHQVKGELSMFNLPLSLMLYFATERRRGAEGGNSFWAPYIHSVSTPQEFANYHPLYAGAELTKKFRALPVTRRIMDLQNALQETWDKHREEWVSLAQGCGVRKLSFEDFKWAIVATISRCFSISWSSYFEFALVPVADLLNHECKKSLDGGFDRSMWQETMTRTVRAGQELTISYDMSANDEGFLNFGFLVASPPLKMGYDAEQVRRLCKPKRIAKMMAFEMGTQPSILMAFKNLLREYCSYLPEQPATLPHKQVL